MGLRKWAIAALVVLLFSGTTAPAVAWLGSERIVTLGDIIFGVEYVIQKPSATLFHTQKQAATDTEALAIAFPIEGAEGAIAPAIAQTTAQTGVASDTGFFKANYCYAGVTNPAGYSLGHDFSAWHPIHSQHPVGSGVSWPYMNNAPLYGGNTMTFRPAINASPDTSGTSLAPGAVARDFGNLSSAGTPISMTAAQGATVLTGPKNATARGTTPEPNRDYKNMTKADVEKMPGLERMYRNSNLKNTVPQTHSGKADQPSAIAPIKSPMDIIKPADKQKVLKESRNMTQAGTHLKTLFWDL